MSVDSILWALSISSVRLRGMEWRHTRPGFVAVSVPRLGVCEMETSDIAFMHRHYGSTWAEDWIVRTIVESLPSYGPVRSSYHAWLISLDAADASA